MAYLLEKPEKHMMPFSLASIMILNLILTYSKHWHTPILFFFPQNEEIIIATQKFVRGSEPSTQIHKSKDLASTFHNTFIDLRGWSMVKISSN